MIFIITPHSNCNFFSDSDMTFFFFTHTNGRWTARSCPNYSVTTNSILPYFAIFTFFCLTNSHMDSVLSHTLCWGESPGFLKGLFATKILGSIHCVYNVWLSWVDRSSCSMVVFHAGAMQITWSIINGFTRKKMHSFKQFQINTNRILKIFKVKNIYICNMLH